MDIRARKFLSIQPDPQMHSHGPLFKKCVHLFRNFYVGGRESERGGAFFRGEMNGHFTREWAFECEREGENFYRPKPVDPNSMRKGDWWSLCFIIYRDCHYTSRSTRTTTRVTLTALSTTVDIPKSRSSVIK